MNQNLKHLIRPSIQAISHYQVVNAEGLIKLDAMENPYTWPDEIRQQWLQLLVTTDVNRYPDPIARILHQPIRESMGIPDDMAIMFGNGSDELIQIMAHAVAESGRTIMAPDPSFVMYKMIASFAGMSYLSIPLNEDFSLKREETLNMIRKHHPALIFLAYPNNPTGNLFDDAIIEEIIRTSKGLVILDEAYHAFTGKSWMSRLGEFDNLLVMRTFSKLGLAGLRLGFLAGPKELVNEFDKVRLPYNINVLTQVSVKFTLEHMDVFEQQTTTIRQQREVVFNALLAHDELTPYPSEANFILFRAPQGRADDIFYGLQANGVLIKNLNKPFGPLADCLRVTIGTPQENEKFLHALGRALDHH